MTGALLTVLPAASHSDTRWSQIIKLGQQAVSLQGRYSSKEILIQREQGNILMFGFSAEFESFFNCVIAC